MKDSRNHADATDRPSRRPAGNAQFDPVNSQLDLWNCLVYMRKTGMNALPVCEGENLVGLVVEEDVLHGLRGPVCVTRQSVVRDVMKRKVYCCYDDQDREQVVQDMATNGIRHALLLSREGHLMGMISLEPLEKSEDQTWVC